MRFLTRYEDWDRMIEGTVLSDQGAVVDGAEVATDIGACLTGSDGRYRVPFPCANALIEAAAPGFPIASFRVPSSNEPAGGVLVRLDLTLVGGGGVEVRGVVTGPGGVKLSGVHVHVGINDPESALMLDTFYTHYSWTDEEGAFLIKGVPTPTEWLDVGADLVGWEIKARAPSDDGRYWELEMAPSSIGFPTDGGISRRIEKRPGGGSTSELLQRIYFEMRAVLDICRTVGVREGSGEVEHLLLWWLAVASERVSRYAAWLSKGEVGATSSIDWNSVIAFRPRVLMASKQRQGELAWEFANGPVRAAFRVLQAAGCHEEKNPFAP